MTRHDRPTCQNLILELLKREGELRPVDMMKMLSYGERSVTHALGKLFKDKKVSKYIRVECPRYTWYRLAKKSE